jgi:LemA protein
MQQRIPDEKAAEVFELAARLYAQHDQSYSVDDLVRAGSEAQIPQEFIQEALQQIQAREIQQQQVRQRRRQLQIVAIALGVIIIGWSALTYNSLSAAEQNVDLAWAQVENQLQRRADLIPNLVRVVQAGARQERDLVALLTQSRQNYLAANTPVARVEAAEQVSEAVNQFQTYIIQNPQLQSNQLFIGLQDELAGTENRLAVERMRYNQSVNAYNRRVRSFPNFFVAGLFGFQPRSLFEANSPETPTIPSDFSSPNESN